MTILYSSQNILAATDREARVFAHTRGSGVLSVTVPHMSVVLHLAPAEMRALAAELTIAAERIPQQAAA